MYRFGRREESISTREGKVEDYYSLCDNRLNSRSAVRKRVLFCKDENQDRYDRTPELVPVIVYQSFLSKLNWILIRTETILPIRTRSICKKNTTRWTIFKQVLKSPIISLN